MTAPDDLVQAIVDNIDFTDGSNAHAEVREALETYEGLKALRANPDPARDARVAARRAADAARAARAFDLLLDLTRGAGTTRVDGYNAGWDAAHTRHGLQHNGHYDAVACPYDCGQHVDCPRLARRDA